MVDIKIITKAQQQTTRWSGGTTTQIAIYPPDADYSARDFLWRLSTAIVEVEESTFTKLGGFDRHLMVLEGELELNHKEQHKVILKQYEQDSFKGAWDTVSVGKARDFNLMLKEGVKGRIAHYRVAQGDNLMIVQKTVEKGQHFFAIYCYRGHLYLNIENQNSSLQEGELLLMAYDTVMEVAVENSEAEACHMIAAFIEL